MSELLEPGHERGDIKLIETAIKRKWNIPAKVLESLPGLVASIAIKTEDDRIKLGAAKVLIQMHGQNLKQDEGPKQGPTINVGVQVDARVEQRRAEIRQIADGIRTRRLSQSPIS